MIFATGKELAVTIGRAEHEEMTGKRTRRLNRRRLADFFAKTAVNRGGCWLWRAAKNDHGYGMFLGTTAHRTAYAWFVGPVVRGAEVDHLCRRRLCVNPAHLELVTKSENNRRAVWPDGRCKRGHVMTPDNVQMVMAKGKRVRTCRQCRRLRLPHRVGWLQAVAS